jgi:hypothetical protein
MANIFLHFALLHKAKNPYKINDYRVVDQTLLTNEGGNHMVKVALYDAKEYDRPS